MNIACLWQNSTQRNYTKGSQLVFDQLLKENVTFELQLFQKFFSCVKKA